MGEGESYPTLAAALRAAADGDTVHLKPGTYYECAAPTQRDLVLEGEGDSSILTDTTCEGKAIIVARGNNLTLRNLVLARARVPDRNGAGVRLEAPDLVLDGVRFENDEVGLLAGGDVNGTITVRGSVFSGGGVGGDKPGFAVLVGAVARLRIESSRIEGVKGGGISSAAQVTELVGNTLSAGTGPGAGPAVFASGHLQMQGNTIELGPDPVPRDAAVLATGTAELDRNRLVNTTGRPAVLLLDWTSAAPRLSDNHVEPTDTLSSSAGLTRHRTGGLARYIADGLRNAARGAKRAVSGLVGR